MEHKNVTPKGLVIAESYPDQYADYWYWTNGEKVFRGIGEIKGADMETFEPLLDEFARDKNYCYLQGHKLKDADPNTFRCLSFTYAVDNKHAWTLVGLIPEADIETFQALDSGKHSLGRRKRLWPDGSFTIVENFVPHGFAKDKNHVYYYDFQGKNKILKSADAATFVSHDDGYFGHDKNTVFCSFAKLPKSNPGTWKKYTDSIFYSRDHQRVYYANTVIKNAHLETFAPVIKRDVTGNLCIFPLAADKDNHYHGAQPINAEEFEKHMQMITNANYS